VDSKLSKDYAIYWRRGGKRSASTKMESYSNNKVDWHQDFEFTGTLYRHKDHFRKKFLKFELHQVEHESKKQKIIGRALIDLGHLAKPNLVVNETQKVDVQLSQKGACTLVISIAATPQSLIKDQFGADFSAMSTVTDADDLDTGAEIDLETDSTPTTTHHADSRDIITFSTADSTKSDTMVHNLQARVAHLSDELDIEKRKRKDETSAIALTLKQAKDERDAARTQTEKFKKLYEYEKNNVQELKNTGEKLKQRSEEVHDNLKWLEIENTNFRDRLTQLEGERKKFDDQLTAERARLQAKIDDHGHSKSELETKIQKQKNLIEKLKEDSKSLSERKDEHIHALQSKLKGEQESATRLQKALDTARDDVKRAIAESSCNDNEKETQRKQMKQDLQSLGDKYTKLQDTFERQHQELESLRSKVKKYREETHQLETQLGSAHRTIEDAKFENLEQQRKIETHEKLISELEEQKTQLEKIQESHIQQKRELDTFKASVNSLTERNNMYKEENSQLTKKLVETVKFFEESSKEQRQKTEEEVQKEKQLMHDLELSNQELKAKIQEIENMQKSVTSLKNDRTQLECRIADVQHEHNALINQQDREQKEHDSKVRELNVRLQTLESESKQYQHKNSILEQENAALRTSKHSNEDHITELKSAVTSLKSSNHAQEEQISKLQSELGALTSEKDSQSSTLEKLNKTVATLEFQVEERDRRITHLREENAEIRDEMTGKHNDTDAHLDTLKTKISSLKSDRRGLEEKVATLMQDNNLIRDEKDVELSGLRAIITTLQNKHDDQEKQLVDLVHRNKTLMEELAEIKKCSSARVQEYEQRIESAHNERDKQKEEFSKLQADNEKLHRSLALAKQNNHSEFNELSQKLNALKKEHAQQTHIIQALENEKDALIQESENSTRLKEQQLEEARTCAQSLGSAKALLEKQLAELQEENVTLKKSNEPKENTIVMSVAALKSEREKYHTEISALQNEIKALRAHNPSGSSTKQNPVELQQENKTLRAENSKLNQRNAETLKSTEEASKMLKAQLKSLQEQIADLQSKEQIAVESNDQTRNELLQAREQVTYLENQHTRLQQELDETKVSIKATVGDDNRQLRTVIGDDSDNSWNNGQISVWVDPDVNLLDEKIVQQLEQELQQVRITERNVSRRLQAQHSQLLQLMQERNRLKQCVQNFLLLKQHTRQTLADARKVLSAKNRKIAHLESQCQKYQSLVDNIYGYVDKEAKQGKEWQQKYRQLQFEDHATISKLNQQLASAQLHIESTVILQQNKSLREENHELQMELLALQQQKSEEGNTPLSSVEQSPKDSSTQIDHDKQLLEHTMSEQKSALIQQKDQIISLTEELSKVRYSFNKQQFVLGEKINQISELEKQLNQQHILSIHNETQWRQSVVEQRTALQDLRLMFDEEQKLMRRELQQLQNDRLSAEQKYLQSILSLDNIQKKHIEELSEAKVEATQIGLILDSKRSQRLASSAPTIDSPKRARIQTDSLDDRSIEILTQQLREEKQKLLLALEKERREKLALRGEVEALRDHVSTFSRLTSHFSDVCDVYVNNVDQYLHPRNTSRSSHMLTLSSVEEDPSPTQQSRHS